MTEREAFVRRICEQPDADDVRLIFADWLDEHGEPERAALIRATRDEIRLRKKYDLARARPSQQWESEPAIEEELWGPLLDVLAWWNPSKFPLPPALRVRCGFITHVEMSPRDLVTFAKDIFAREPIESVSLWDVVPELDPRYNETEGSPHIIIGVDTSKDVLFGCRVPMPIYDLMDGHIETAPHDDGLWPHKVFTSGHAAMDSVCRASVTFGRREAKLPPLPTKARAA